MNWLGVCAVCGKRIRWDDEVCSDACQEEHDRRADEALGACAICGHPAREDSLAVGTGVAVSDE